MIPKLQILLYSGEQGVLLILKLTVQNDTILTGIIQLSHTHVMDTLSSTKY